LFDGFGNASRHLTKAIAATHDTSISPAFAFWINDFLTDRALASGV
jgi:hypothetical protein